MQTSPDISIANPHLHFDKVSLIQPSKNQFLLLAAEVDKSIFPFYLHTSKRKKKLLKVYKKRCSEIKSNKGIVSALVFKAILVPPGRGKLLKERPNIHKARFDVVILLEIQEGFRIDEIKSLKAYKEIEELISRNARHTFFMIATNIKRINTVDHTKQGVFLFNYFYADDLKQNIKIWEYTAGWFQQETGLNNSTLLLPKNPEESQYKVINHCRWNSLLDILPSLIIKRSFKEYVLDNFYKNNVGAMPILYKLT